ncbi:PEGA domain-containing protein [Pendulispora rubella]|uniref:PEGA domain-containing protein n=1 Tax=Pendulispora rubella TaxID=2741070 RepID=A0ABZ2L835_9BACT
MHFARLAVVLGLIALASPAWADDPNALIEHGVALREQGRDEEALAEFRKAFTIAPTPRAQAQLGLAEQALGLWVAAEADVRDALKSQGDPWIQKNRAVLEQSLRTIAQHLGTLEVRGRAGAALFVDGAQVGQLPLERGLRIEAGHRTLEVRAEGFQSTSRTIIVSPGETARETIELRPSVTREEPSTPVREPRPNDVPPPPASSGATQRTLGWVLTGVGGAALVTGVIGLIARANAVSAYNDDPSCPGTDNPAPRPSQCQSHVDAEGTWKAIAIAGLAGGAALGAGGLALVLTAPRGPHGTAGISLSGTF